MKKTSKKPPFFTLYQNIYILLYKSQYTKTYTKNFRHLYIKVLVLYFIVDRNTNSFFSSENSQRRGIIIHSKFILFYRRCLCYLCNFSYTDFFSSIKVFIRHCYLNTLYKSLFFYIKLICN